MRKKPARAGRDEARARVLRLLAGPAGDPLTWDIEEREDLAIVVIDGELDVGTVPGLGGPLVPLAEAGRHLILDLAGVRFCDCAGLGLFLRLHRDACAAGGSLQLAALSVRVGRLITVARLGDVLMVTDSPQDAIAALGLTAATGPPRPGPMTLTSPHPHAANPAPRG
ncbi:MAG: STAS domain-containing protein [Streptosporangiaceae bacterium]